MPAAPWPSRLAAAVPPAIALLGLVAGWAAYRAREQESVSHLVAHARLAAAAFDEAELRRLTGSRQDLGTPDYASIKARLRLLAQGDPDLKFAYLFRPEPATGRVIFLADSAAPGAKDESLPGDVYPQAPASPGLQEILRTGRPATEGPLTDDFGTWVTGYAPVVGRDGTAPAGPPHVVGLDVAAAHWREELWRTGALGAIVVWIGLGMPWGAWIVVRRRREHDERIRQLSDAHLREATELAQAADRAKGQFLATMSHEVRTPLNGIVGFTSLLMETPLSEEQREYVQTIRMSTEALIQLTGDILDFARTEAGKLKLDPLPCDPRGCVEDALDLLAAKAGAKGIELIHHADPAVPATVLADSGRLRQVLFNLVGNAVKFTDRGEVEVTVTRADAAPAPEPAPEGGPAEECTLVFAVRDTGIGIAPEHHGRLFRPFSQIDESTTRRYGGTGLGLAICRSLVGLMGGEIGVASAPGAGSTFTFSIRVPVVAASRTPQDFQGRPLLLAAPPGPVRREIAALLRGWRATVREIDSPDALPDRGWELALVEVSETLARTLAAAPDRNPDWSPERMIGLVPISLSNELRATLRRNFRFLVNKPVHHDPLFTLLSGALARDPAAVPVPALGLRVLLVEDDAVNQQVTRRMLEILGCRPTLAIHGREALDLLIVQGEEIDVMILDMHMPEMDGLATLAAVRHGHAGPAVQSLPVLALTADARERQREEGMAAGLTAYLTKPVKLAELERELRRLRPGRRPAAE